MNILQSLNEIARACGLEYLDYVMSSSLAVEAAVKFLAAVVLAGAVGYERQQKGEAAGLRTHILVCLGAVMLMIVSEQLAIRWAAAHAQVWLDQGRMAAGIITGVGFLGGGAILHYKREHHGLTTAALIWFVASLGVAIGAGYLSVALIATIFVMVTVVGLGRLELFLPNRRDIVLELRVKKAGLDMEALKQSIKSMGITRVMITRLSSAFAEDEVDITFNIETKTVSEFEGLLRQLHERFASASNMKIER